MWGAQLQSEWKSSLAQSCLCRVCSVEKLPVNLTIPLPFSAFLSSSAAAAVFSELFTLRVPGTILLILQ